MKQVPRIDKNTTDFLKELSQLGSAPFCAAIYGNLKPVTLVDAILEAIKRGYTYMDGQHIKDALLDELKPDKKPEEMPCHILVNAFIIDLSTAWDDRGNIYFLDT